jgi:rhodanese-related sulfurtransferase
VLIGILISASACKQSAATIRPIEPAELAERMQKGTAPIILDVRSREEYAAEHIRGAINIPYDQLEERLDRLPAAKSEEIIVHCERGRRAAAAEEILSAAGYENLRDLTGHMQAWEESGLPVE